jgi:multiple sugar transport system substrate-binding protein
MEFVKRLYTEAMDPEVLAWDDASNNRCLNAGKCFAIHNPISAYESAKKDQVVVPGTKQPIAEVIDHVNTPRGPKGRYATTGFWCVGIWNFSKNIDAAKDFLRFHFQPDNQARWVEAGHGFNMPFLNNLTITRSTRAIRSTGTFPTSPRSRCRRRGPGPPPPPRSRSGTSTSSPTCSRSTPPAA